MDIDTVLNFFTKYAVALTAIAGILGVLGTVVGGLIAGHFSVKAARKAAELNKELLFQQSIQQIRDAREALKIELRNLLDIYDDGEGSKIQKVKHPSVHFPERGYIPAFSPPLMLNALGSLLGKLDNSDCGFFLLAYRTAEQLQNKFQDYNKLSDEREYPRSPFKDAPNYSNVIETRIRNAALDIQGLDINFRHLIKLSQALLDRPLDSYGKPVGSVEETFAKLKTDSEPQ